MKGAAATDQEIKEKRRASVPETGEQTHPGLRGWEGLV